ncbi:hypothetical protein QQS21_008145 [Conoideocrella luteorostrata]|uniref:Uncharacterized protein n=1 Tax=Conoideocrella luteorostrata TaxID=1105319 RepID=A0AAJ0FRG0_9HYPO|nr:hypothetical protein QQS21_008145 [Conoideocrella luteorostrata]
MAAQGARTALPVDIPSFTREKEAISDLRNDVLNEERFIVQSPYVDKEHLLDLETLDNENSLLSRALSRLRAVREDYATALYTESFNWQEVLDELKQLVQHSGKGFKETSFYIVAFRSQIKPSTDYSHLGELDKAAHAEAVASGGFLKYWFGSPDAELRNLATCLWRSRQDALEGGRGSSHRKAAGATRSLYAYWKIDQHRLTIRENVDSWEITEWE